MSAPPPYKPHTAKPAPVRRRPVTIAHAYPPTVDEMRALYDLALIGVIGDVSSVDIVKTPGETARLILLVEWIGETPVPDVLQYGKAARAVKHATAKSEAA